jgi:gluconate 2-dehydrogenase gamma chain
MKRRDSLKLLATGALAGGALLTGCKPGEDKKTAAKDPEFKIDRAKEELVREKKLLSETFFTPHEMATITVLADIIIPKDEVSGSAGEAGVPAFIEFIVKDMPDHQIPMRGGLRWMDMQCLAKHNTAFKDCTPQQQLALVDAIAYPDKAKKEMKAGVSFFSLLRNLTASGFYTSEIGVKDIGYMGNTPNAWDGVPADVLKQYNMAYTEKELNECVKHDEK